MKNNKYILFSGLSLAIGILVVLACLYFDNKFFFLDDKQAFTLPYATDIARSILRGNFPFMSLATAYGGNYAIDWQHGLLNPFSLLTYLFIFKVDNLQIAGALLAAPYIILISLGTYKLAVIFKVNHSPALLFATIITTNNFLLYWAGGTWHNHLVGATWFLWAWLFMELSQQNSRAAIIGLVASIYLTLTSGFPQAGIAVSILTAGYIYKSIITREWIFLLNITASSLASLLLAAPDLLPAFYTLSETARETTSSNNGLLSPTLGDYLQLGFPLSIPRIYFWNPEMHVPIFYLAWFIPPLIPFINYGRALELIKIQAPALLTIIALMLLGTGPESLGPLRYPFRFIPFLHILVGAMFFVLFYTSGPLVINRNRFTLATSIIALTTIAAFLEQPGMWRTIISSGLFLIFMLGISIRLYLFRGHAGMLVGLFLGTIAIFTATHFLVPKNVDVADWSAPENRTDFGPLNNENFSGYSLYVGDNLSYRSKGEITYFSGTASGIWSGRYTFNGYTTLGRKELQHDLCLEIRSQTLCPAGVKKWTEIDSFSHASLLDLFKINDVVVQNGMWRDELIGTLNNGWYLAHNYDNADEFKRISPSNLPGTLSWHSTGIAVDTRSSVLQNHEKLFVKGNTDGGRLIFARVFWPGYFATLNDQPLNVLAHNNLLLAIDLPPNATGRLDIRFRPPGFLLGLFIAGLGLFIVFYILLRRNSLNRAMGDIRSYLVDTK